MHAFAPRRSTDSDVSAAITLGWRIAKLYSLRAAELPTSPPDNLLPVRTSLPAMQRLALELRAAAGDAARVGAELDAGELDELFELAAQAPGSDAAEDRFRERIRDWHVHLETMLWADHEATGKAYELGSFMSDTYNRVVLELRRPEDAHGHVTRELRCVFARERIERVKRLLDDLQARIDPAAVRIVKEHLAAWQAAVQERTPRAATGAGLEPLDSQTVIWCQLVTGDKEPEAFIDHDDRARVRETMIRRMVLSYRTKWKRIVVFAAVAAVIVTVVTQKGVGWMDAPSVVAFLGPLVGGLGVSVASIGMTVRKSLDARAELLWNTALVAVISRKTLRVDDVLPRPRPHRRRMTLRTRRRSVALLQADRLA
ncbi:MAG: hypothetical protein ACRDLN_07645 [Solirubrobacteraceae bacterium]